MKKSSSISDSRRFFASMDVMPLEMEMIERDENDNYFIKEGYAVTDKADGEHYLLYVSNHDVFKGRIYLINNRMEVKQTGLLMQNPLLYGSLLDGELVLLKDSTSYNVETFDCFFWGGSDIRDYPLYVLGTPTEKIEKFTNRYQA